MMSACHGLEAGLADSQQACLRLRLAMKRLNSTRRCSRKIKASVHGVGEARRLAPTRRLLETDTQCRLRHPALQSDSRSAATHVSLPNVPMKEATAVLRVRHEVHSARHRDQQPTHCWLTYSTSP